MLRFNLQENRFKKAVGLGKISNIKIDEKLVLGAPYMSIYLRNWLYCVR